MNEILKTEWKLPRKFGSKVVAAALRFSQLSGEQISFTFCRRIKTTENVKGNPANISILSLILGAVVCFYRLMFPFIKEFEPSLT